MAGPLHWILSFNRKKEELTQTEKAILIVLGSYGTKEGVEQKEFVLKEVLKWIEGIEKKSNIGS